jgi:hypothetical protein
MGHYMTALKETGDEYKFPEIEASILPLVWLGKGIGDFKLVVRYVKPEDTERLVRIVQRGTEYERETAKQVLQALNDSCDEEVILEIELSASAGSQFLKMFKEILPTKIIFDYAKPVGHWEVKHDHMAVPIKLIHESK